MNEKNEVKIRVFGSRKDYAERDKRDEAQVQAIVREHLLAKTEAPYHKVNVKIKRHYDDTPNYLIVYLLRKDIYSAEIARIDVDSDFQVKNVEYSYDDSDESDDDDEFSDTLSSRPEPEFDWSAVDEYAYDFVVATPVPEIATALAAVNKIFDIATSIGLKPKKLLGDEATVANYQQYLQSGVKGFVNVGHGSPSSIVLDDGVLTAVWFNSLVNAPLKPTVVYFNSCQVCNDPLKAAVVKAGARVYIGGIVNLLIGPSEAVCQCFWNTVLTTSAQMKSALTKCELDHYPNQGAHGFVGEDKPFSQVSLLLAHAMWVHGHSMEVEYPDRLALHQRVGSLVHTIGKPFTSNWYHFAVPSPVIMGGKRSIVGSVMLRFRVGPGASVYAVHIYDGENRIATHDNLNLTPQGNFAFLRFDVPMHPKLQWGLGISIGVKFGDSANLPPATRLHIDFSAVGCDFMMPAAIIVKPAIEIPSIIDRDIRPDRVPEPQFAVETTANGGETNGKHIMTAGKYRPVEPVPN